MVGVACTGNEAVDITATGHRRVVAAVHTAPSHTPPFV
jgi:hypothetical protein